MPERWLVIGARGLLAPRVVECIEARGLDVVVAARESLQGATGRSTVALDLADPSSVESLFGRLPAPVDRVLCVAAMARGGACERDPRLAEQVNAIAVGQLADASVRAEAHFTLVSTDLVFDGRACPTDGYGEEHDPAPIGVYAATKLEGERAVLAHSGQGLVVRLPLLYGHSRGLGSGATDALVDGLEAGQPQTLFTDEWRTPLEVGAAARGLVELAGGGATGLLHLPGPERVSRAELGRRSLAALGWTGPGPSEGTRAELGLDKSRPEDCSLDGRRARARLSFELPDLDRGLAVWVDERGRS
ncbi:MAG: SDR family oxidoreductase [Planctomycetota bacterium]|jgi:dTDP-4-dehydrorhamnose reductase